LNKLNLFFIVFFILGVGSKLFAQNDREKIGEDELKRGNVTSYFNFSDKNKVNIEVNLWGYIKNPGVYLVPNGTKVLDLIAYGGGLQTTNEIDKIRLFRQKNDTLGVSKDNVTDLDYRYLVGGSKGSGISSNPVLNPGDILVILEGEPKRFFSTRENVAFYISIASALASFAVLLITVFRK
jgi:protein involved in polysaccharide export with SLBB domain